VRKAVEKGLQRIEKGSANYLSNASCFSCHHQYHALAVLTAAKKRGFSIDKANLPRQIEFTLETFRPHEEEIRKGRGIPGGNTMAAYALLALDQAGHRADDTTAMLIEYLLVRQKPEGAWPAVMPRPPSEGSTFTNNTLALRAMKQWAPKGESKAATVLGQRMEKAAERGRDWLLKNQPKDTEDRAFLLRGLVVAGVESQLIEQARKILLEQQQTDGGWAQLPNLQSDAYATGIVLVALLQSGSPADHPAVRKGVKYLIQTQKQDGSWLVTTRSKPVQKWFDNDDPHGKSQFISMAATGWAVQALLETLPVR
jgi:N-acyl-D-amino-acid deacylase